jgi:hypothetical protein
MERISMLMKRVMSSLEMASRLMPAVANIISA